MRVANASQGTVGLPPELMTAQEAINLPEIQEMLRRLSEYNLGICMPHMHDEQTGVFQPLPKELVQVEDGLEVSFRSAEEIRNQRNRYIPVAWSWRDGALAEEGMCFSYCQKAAEDDEAGHRQKHRK